MPIERNEHSTAFTGTDGVNWFRYNVITSAIGLYLKTGMQANRMYTPQAMRDAATGLTGKSYKRSHKGLEQAYKDLVAQREAEAAKVLPNE